MMNKEFLNYLPIYEKAFDGLAKMQIPDLNEFDSKKVFWAFAFLGSGEHGTTGLKSQKNLDWMCSEVCVRSGNLVEMRPTKFYTGIKGPNAQYILTDGTIEEKLVFAPSNEPFKFY